MFLAKTICGLERIAALRIKDILGNVKIEINPNGYHGLLLIHTEKEIDIPEIETLIPIKIKCKATISDILKTSKEISRFIKGSFAVRVTRRGNHDFTSMEVAKKLGSEIQKITGANVDLENPEKAVYVEIIGDKAYLGIIPGSAERRKYKPFKKDARSFLKKITFVQTPYLGSGAKEMGIRIGRAAQAFEIKELIIAPYGYISCSEFVNFLSGVLKGQESRYKVQQRAYARGTKFVKVKIMDLYQTVRDKRKSGNILIVTDPTGKAISELDLRKDLHRAKEIVIFAGSREGIPKGISRFADYVLDLAPYITFATEHTLPAAISVLVNEWLK